MSSLNAVLRGCKKFDHSPDMVSSDVVQRVQIDLAALLQSIVQLLQNKHIRYSIEAGTLLGAVRDGRFIPWDDDLDISIHTSDWAMFERELRSSGLSFKKVTWHGSALRAAQSNRSEEYVWQISQPHPRSNVQVHADMKRANFEFYKPMTRRVAWQNTEYLFDEPMHAYNLSGVLCVGPNIAVAKRYLDIQYRGNWRQPICHGDALDDFNIGAFATCCALAIAAVARAQSDIKQSKCLFSAACVVGVVALYGNWVNFGRI